MKLKLLIPIGGIVIFAIGFFVGMEYKAYQVRSAISEAFTDVDSDGSSSTSITTQAPTREPEPIIITRAIGNEVELTTIKLKVNTVEERQNISSSYSSPKVAKEGAKFIVVNMDVINTTDKEFYFSPDFVLMDKQNRKFSYYSEMIGSIDNYLVRDISPSIRENGNVVYEIPSDADGYSLMISKAGTNEVYQIVLKP